jgi:hypothetical protein
MAQNSDTARSVTADVIRRIWTDPSYKAQFLSDPRDLLNEAFAEAGVGEMIPPSATVTVLEDTPTTQYFVVPPSDHENYTTINDAVDKIIASLPAGISGQKIQQSSDDDQYFVIPVQPPGISLANLSTREIAIVAAASGTIAVNTTVAANVYVAANLEGVQNAVGATEVAGVAIAVVAGVLT